MAGCTDPEQQYQHLRIATEKQPPPKLLGFNLHLGASRQQVAQSFDSLRRQKALLVRIVAGKATLHASLEPVPLFAQDTLIGLQLQLPAGPLTKPIIVGLLDSLRGVYGREQYRPATDDWYWFRGSTEIDYGFSIACHCHRIAYTTLGKQAQQ
ncbi:MAG: hypothetical protein ACRYFZ_14020 [Janthinobacterium lividum]